jgi:hypothetical protein
LKARREEEEKKGNGRSQTRNNIREGGMGVAGMSVGVLFN